MQAAAEREKVRILIQGLGQDADGLGLAGAPDLIALLFRLGQDDLPIAVGDGPDFQILLLALGPEPGGDAIPLGPHPGIDAGRHRFRKVSPLDPDIDNFNAEILFLSAAADAVQHFVKDGGAGVAALKERQPFIILDRIAGFVDDGFRADNLEAVAQGHPIPQSGSDDVPQAAAGVVFRLQGLAELHRVGNPVAGIGIDNQVLLFLVRHSDRGGVNPQNPLVEGGDGVHEGGFDIQPRGQPGVDDLVKAQDDDLLGFVHDVKGLAEQDDADDHQNPQDD